MTVLAAIAMVAALAQGVTGTLIGGSTASAAPAPPPTNVLRLNVSAAMASAAAGGPHAGDAVASYKWLIQKDQTGDPQQPSGPVAANDGFISCSGGTCTLRSPSAPFLFKPGSSSPDVGVQVTGTGLAPTATIATVIDAKTVTLSPGAYSGPAVSGTYLFSIQRADPCHPVTPATPKGDPKFPANCQWPSIHLAAHAPVVTQGDQTDWSTTQDLSGVVQSGANKGSRCALNVPAAGCNLSLPDGKYFVSVTADGYEIGGSAFTIPMQPDVTSAGDSRGFGTVKVGLNPGPLTLGTLKILVFDDMAPTGGAYEATTESGMAGFSAQITDFTANPVSQDYFGNPLCTTYKTDAQGNTQLDSKGQPTVVKLGGQCLSKHTPGSANTENDGLITIPNLAPGRYGVSVIPPDKGWIQTTTLEGAHDFDVWLMGNDSGLDTEMVAGGEPVPFVHFGFTRAAMTANKASNAPAYATAGCRVPPPSGPDGTPPSGDIAAQLTSAMRPCQGANLTPRIDPGFEGQKPTPDGSLQADSWQYPYDPSKPAPTGSIAGNVVSMEPYVPGVGGLNGVGGANGQAGLHTDNRPVRDAWVAMADLNNGDQTAMVAPVKDDGTFTIANVPDGTYSMAWWDWNQDYAFDSFQVNVVNGQAIRLGAVPLLGWFTRIEGHVFVDKNGNGQKDPGEEGVSDFLMQLLNRTNNAFEQGQNVATTNDAGFYQIKEAYPLGNDMVLQFFNTRYKTTGVTCQADNDPQQHTLLTAAVDLTTLNIIGLNGRCDVGVTPYSTDPTGNDNGGIVATAMYHSFHTEYTEEQAVPSPWDTGLPGVRYELWKPRHDPSGKGTYLSCSAALANDPGCPNGADGSLVRDAVPFDPTNAGQVSVYASEHYARPGQNGLSQPGCVPRGAEGQPLDYTYQQSIQLGGDCVEAALQGTSFGFGSDANPVDPLLYNKPDPIDPSHNTGDFVNGPDPYPGLNAYCAALNPTLTLPAPSDQVAGGQCGPHGVQVVDGNYGLTPPGPGDYIVRPVIPNDMFGKPLYKWASEANNNTYEGPGWIPQNASGPITWPFIPTGNPANAGPQGKGYSNALSTSSPSPDAKCAGSQQLINNTDPSKANFVQNPSWVDYWSNTPANGGAIHGGPWEGQSRPLCDAKIIHVQNGQSVAPNFYMFTDVPLATAFQGYAVDDISVSTNKLSTSIGEVAGIPNMPIGLYDWTGRQVAKVDTDYNGQFAVMLPSTNTFNCNSAAGPCPGVYRFVGNDPGQPNAPNLNYNPVYRTISANFQAWPDVFSPADVAPTKAVVSFEGNGQQFTVPAICAARGSEPQVFAVSHPFFKSNRSDTETLTIQGLGFGSQRPGEGNPDAGVTLRDPNTGARVARLDIQSWNDTQIRVEGMDGVRPGPYQLMIQNSAGFKLTNGITFHVLGSRRVGGTTVTYNPTVYEVGTFRTGVLNANGVPAGPANTDNNSTRFNPNAAAFLPPNAFPGDGKVKGAVQRSLEAAAKAWLANKSAQSLIVVYPNFQLDPTTGRYGGVAWDPLSAYFENIIIHSPVTLQGSGGGGLYKDNNGNTVAVPGSTIDGRFYNANTTAPATTSDTQNNEPWATDWATLQGNINAAQPVFNNGLLAGGEVVAVVGNTGWYSQAGNGFRPTIDGLGITGGDQKGFPGNISEINGAKSGAPPDETFVQDIQGGGIMLNGYAQHFQISNNQIQWNSGTYGGAIRSGSPQIDPAEDNPNSHNDDLHINNNRIVANGGTNLAGGLGLFRGTSNYRINDNVICGNLSAEYGGGISHFGYSPGGQIDHNKIMLNQAIDEGGGIMIAGEPPINPNTSAPDPSLTSMGAGPVSIHDNQIGDNMAYDDGGGIRFLQAGVFPFDVSNNMITDNVSAHEGGGVAIDDAPNVRLVHDTIANNLTTATAVTSDGQPAPAGVSTAGNSRQLQDFLLGTRTVRQDQPNGTVTQASCTQESSAATCSNLAGVPYSKPSIFNSIVTGNLAGTWDSLHSTVTGIGLPQNLQNGPACPAPAAPCVTPTWDPAVNNWDIGVADRSDVAVKLQPTNSLIGSAQGWAGAGPGDVVGADPGFVQAYVPAVQSDPYRLQPRFRPSTLVTVNLPANVLGDYHIKSGSGAGAIGAFSSLTPSGDTVTRPRLDIDGDIRPCASGPSTCGTDRRNPDAGADQRVGARAAAVRIALVTPLGGGRMLATGLPAAEPASVAADPVTPAGPVGVTGGRTVAPAVVPAAPPAGSVANVVQTGDPNEAGNTPLVQLYGPKPAISGVPQVQPASQGGAPMPGGVKGGGHFKAPGAHHVFHRYGKSVAARVWDFVTSPAALVLALLGLALAVWARRRRRRPPPRGWSGPLTAPRIDAERPLVLAEKGERP
jgi:hypothetical protein